MRRLTTLTTSAATVGMIMGAGLMVAPTSGAAVVPLVTRVAGVPAAALPDVSWEACTDAPLKKAGAVCGTLSVPLDHSRPGGTKIELALSMVKHTVPDDQYQGITLVNPGGPGGSGRVLSALGRLVPKDAGAAYDWIGFDPRGVGASRPALNCIKTYFAPTRPPYPPTTAALEKTWLARSKAYATACGKNGGPLLENMRTEDVARDMDLIRAALKAPQVNYYGYSYGTYLGQVYSTMFPGKVRRMVLDSNIDPTKVFYQSNLDQNLAFQRNIEIFWGWIAKNDATYHLGSTQAVVAKLWYAERTQLAKAPVGKLGYDEWTDAFLSAGYVQAAWPGLAKLWADWRTTHNPGPLLEKYASTSSPTDDNGFAVYNAVQCTDAPWPKSWATWKADNWRVNAKAPYGTWANAWFNAPCLYWPARSGRAVNVDGTNVPPILLIGETLDAATPFGGSLEARKRFPKASLIALPGGTNHANSLSGNECLDNQIADYLADGTLPERKAGNGPDATCDPLPVPEPTATGASGSATATGRAALRQILIQNRL